MKEKTKIILAIFITMVTTLSITAVAVFRASAGNITFSSDKTEKDNVEESLNELYDMAGSASDSPTHSNLSTDGLIALNEMVEMDHPATTQLAATKDWRYTGLNPHNYILFNNEMWRIIGVFNVGDGTGTLEKRIKIIRDNAFSNHMAWDTENVNDYSTSSLKTYLNGDYYNSLTTEAKSKIKEAKWYLGGWNSYYIKSSEWYDKERGETTYQNSHQTNWTGKIGLMYMSDYGFAVGGDDRATCLETKLSYWNNDTPSCRNNDWIHISGHIDWTIIANSGNASTILLVYNNGNVITSNANSTFIGIRPSLYLKPNVTLTGGGTEIEPYVID